MTEQEAIEILNPSTTLEALAKIEYYGGFNGKEAQVKAVEEACILAVKALEKQVPKEPQGMKEDICPMCFTFNEIFPRRVRTIKKDIVYCWHCGQAIDLSE